MPVLSKKMQLSRRGAARAQSLMLVAAGAVAVAANVASAADYTWTRGAGNNNWDNALNWSSAGGTAPPQVPAVGETTNLVYAGTTATVNTSSSMRQDYTVDSIHFASDFNHGSTNTFSLNTASTLLPGATTAHLTVGAGGMTFDVTIYNINITRNTAVAVADATFVLAADQTWATNAPAASTGAITVTMSRQITGGNFVVTKTGTGVFVMSMPVPNSGWTGGIDLVEGSIRTGGGGTLAGLNGQLGTGPIRSTSANDVSITSSTISNIGGGADRLFDNDMILGGTGQLTLGGSFGINFTNQSTWTLQGDKLLGVSVSTQHDGNITGPFGFTKENGGILKLNGASDYTGVTTVADGVLQPLNAAALGATAGGTVVEDGAALELLGGITIAGETLSVAGVGEGTANVTYGIDAMAGALRSRSGNNEWSGAVTVTAPDTYVAVDAGELNLSGGVSGAAGSVRVGGAGLLRAKNFDLQGMQLDAAARVRVNPNGTAAGRTNLGTMSFAGGPLTPAAQFDLTNNALVVSGATLADVASLVAAGYAAGAWTGTGITSSTAAATPGTGLGYADAAAVPGGPIFGTPPAGSVLVRYTLLGDADLSGSVGIGDFAQLAANFNTAGTWSGGDFNYDGTVGIGDFSLLAANFNQSLPASAGARGGAVPEPTSAVLLGAAAAAGLAVRRRRGR